MKKRKLNRKQILIILSVLILFVGAIVLINRHLSPKPTEEKLTSAFNPKIPQAHLKDKPKNKLELYMEAMKDSVQHANERLKDPYVSGKDTTSTIIHSLPPAGRSVFSRRTGSNDVNETKVNDRLSRLLKELNQPVETQIPVSNIPSIQKMAVSNPDIVRMEKLLQTVNTNTGNDQDLQKLDTLVNKLIQLQTGQVSAPSKTDAKSKPARIALPVTNYPVILPDSNYLQTNSGFYGLDNTKSDSPKVDQTAIKAIIQNDQVVQDGSTVQIRLNQDMYIKDLQIPAGQLIAGYATIANERVQVKINSIMSNNAVYPVALVLFDLDGLPGINVPGAVTVESAKEGMNQAVQSMDVYAPVDNIGAQVAVSGLAAARSLIGKKLRKVQVTIKAGHEVILKILNF
jgi:conjugative transposon TraM protein